MFFIQSWMGSNITISVDMFWNLFSDHLKEYVSRVTFAKRIPAYYWKRRNQHLFLSQPKKDEHTKKHTSFPPHPSESKFHSVSKHAALQVAGPKHEVIKLSDLRPTFFFFGFRMWELHSPPPERWSCEFVFESNIYVVLGSDFIFWGYGVWWFCKHVHVFRLVSATVIRKVSFLWKSLRTKHRDGDILVFFFINLLFDSSVVVVWGEESLSGQMLWYKALWPESY